MYKVKMDGRTLYFPGDKEATLANPVLKLKVGFAGSFEFTVPPVNPEYAKIKNRHSMITVYRDAKEIFYGEVRKQPKKDRFNNLQVYCAGAMSFLADSIQPQMEYHDMTPRMMLSVFLDNHNAQVEERKKIYVGNVTVTDPNNSLYRYTNREDTLSAIRKKLVEKLGGHLRLRHENDKLYLDWITIEEYGKYCEQPIEFGLNMMDYSESRNGENIATALIPLGARLENENIGALDKYVDITSVNGGKDYIYNPEAVENFGWIWKTVAWQDVNEPSNLKRKGIRWLNENQFEELTLQLTAIDLSLMDKEYDSFEIGDAIPCRAKAYGMNKVFPVMEMTVPLMKPEAATLTLGETRKIGYTEQQSTILSGMQTETAERNKIVSKEIQQAIDELTNKMIGATGGYKLTEYDASGKWLRDLYMDAPDKNQATKILQINKEGIGGSKNGYNGPYTVGMTLDGQIIGERILANSITAEKLSVEYTQQLETKFTQVENSANDYTDRREKTVRQTISTSIKTLEKQIQLSVLDQKSIVSSYDYITGGDNQKLDLNKFTVASNLSMTLATKKNINGFMLTKSDTNSTNFTQNLGELPAGDYEVQMKIYLEPGAKIPNYIYFGIAGYTSYQSMMGIKTGEWATVKRTVNLPSKAVRMFVCTIYGEYASTIYATDVRVLRNVKELIDDVDARISVEVGKISQKVSEVYESQQHDYIQNGNFTGTPSNYWHPSDGSNVIFTNYKNKDCVRIYAPDNTSYYVRSRNSISIPKAGKFKVRFKACSDRTNCQVWFSFRYGTYTTLKDVTMEWKEFVMEFPGDIPAGNKYLYIYNKTQGSTLYITDIELLGYATHFNSAQIDLMKDEITHTVKKNEFASYVKQYYNSVIVAFNNSSKYVQINAGEIAIYDYGVEQSKKRAVFDENGNHFWRDGYEVGKIGTNRYSSNNALKGLVFDLEYEGAYMTWATEETPSAPHYTMIWTYAHKSVGNYAAGRLHAGCDIDMHGWTLRNPSFEGGGITGTMNFVQIKSMSSNGTVASWVNGCLMEFKNGILIRGTWNN